MDMEKTDKTASIFATYPRDDVTILQAMASSINMELNQTFTNLLAKKFGQKCA